uniref:Uncharacterized protein n=1 Tax=Eptatretus burgeri TaxID=7764 RepID=A0A8C4R9K1_EPTBU
MEYAAIVLFVWFFFCFLYSACKAMLYDLSYLEYVFEASRRPDLLTLLVDYRRQGNTATTIPRLPRMPSARKYHGKNNCTIINHKLDARLSTGTIRTL